MCNLDYVHVKPIEDLERAHKKKYPDDTIQVLQVNAPDCLVEWTVSDPAMVLRGWAFAEDKPLNTNHIRWYSRESCGGEWPGFLQPVVEKLGSDQDIHDLKETK
jgi:hypothetical protein